MCKVLILDDEESMRNIIGQAVGLAKLISVEAENSISGLSLIDKYPTIRIVICDLHLPGMDGMTFCRKVKRLDPLMIMIALTGYQTLFSIVECRQSGFDDVLFKPQDITLLPKVLTLAHERVQRWTLSKNNP